jgi:hypothetical protein
MSRANLWILPILHHTNWDFFPKTALIIHTPHEFPTLWGWKGKWERSIHHSGDIFFKLSNIQASVAASQPKQRKNQAHGSPRNELWHVPTLLVGRCTFGGWCTLHLVCVVLAPPIQLYAQLLKRNNWEGGRGFESGGSKVLGHSWVQHRSINREHSHAESRSQ